MLKLLLFSLICLFTKYTFAAPNYQGCYRPQARGYCGFHASTFQPKKSKTTWLQITYISLPGLSDPICDSADPQYFSYRSDGNFWSDQGEYWIPRGTTLISPSNVVNFPTNCP